MCLAVKPVGEPDAVAPHVRFDERGWETGRWPSAPSYRAHPRLYRVRPAGKGQSMAALPGTSDIDLFGYSKRVVDFDTEVAHRALDLLMP